MADFNGSYSYILMTIQTLLKQLTVQVNKMWVGMEALPMVLVILELAASWLLSRGSVSKLHKEIVLLSKIVCLKIRPFP